MELRLIAFAALAGMPALADAPRTPVLVELFTSEGCSSCPPADAALLELAKAQPVAGAEIIPLGFHVDYWNDLGWSDPFSAAAFSARQSTYARDGRVYTPQMVVDGVRRFVGEEGEARRAVLEAARVAKAPLRLERQGARAAVQWGGAPGESAGLEFWLAVTEDGLSSVVARGENRGRHLSHTAVVRALYQLSPDAGGAAIAEPKVAPAWNAAQLRWVAWAQERASHRVRAVASVSTGPASGAR